MANELLPISRGDFRSKVEVTYDDNPGTDSGKLEVGTALYVEEFTSTIDDGMRQRQGMSPYGPGFRAFKTLRTGEFSGQSFISPLTLSVGNEIPEIDPLWRLVGMSAGVAATPAGSKTLTYTMLAHGQGSSTIESRLYDEADANATLTTLTGCRAQGVITIVGGDAAILDFSGMAATSTLTNLGAGPQALSYADVKPLVGGDSTVTITEVLGDSVFAGLLFDAEITCYPVLPSNGIGGRVIQMRPGAEPIAVTMTMEQQTLDDWDLQGMIAACTALQLHIATPAATAGGNSLEFDLLCQPLAQSSEEGPAGNMVWAATFIVIFPEASADGGGLDPAADAFTVTYRTTDP